MEKRNNLSDIKGVIFSKPIKPFTYKKGPKKGQDGEMRFLVLEIRGNGNGKEYIEFHKFKIVNPSVSLEDFEIKDPVVITYALGGNEWNGDIINETKAIYIKHADVDYNDTTDLRPERPGKTKQDEVFKGAIPNDDDEESNLPF